MAGYYRKFIKDFSKIARPLINLTKKDSTFTWTEECNQAFNKLKESLAEPPILAYPNPEEPFEVHTDASNYGIGAVLTQVQEGKERVIAFASRVLNKLLNHRKRMLGNYLRSPNIPAVPLSKAFHGYYRSQSSLLAYECKESQWEINKMVNILTRI